MCRVIDNRQGQDNPRAPFSDTILEVSMTKERLVKKARDSYRFSLEVAVIEAGWSFD